MAVFRLSVVPRLLLFAALIISLTKSEGIQISFPHFSANDSSMMRAYGDVQYNQDHQSFILNAKSSATSTATCSLLLYGITNLRLQDIASSFSTSFTFKFTTPPEQPSWDDFNTSLTSAGSSLYFGITNTLYNAWISVRINETSSCTNIQGMKGFFGFLFQTSYNYNKGEPSNNFIALSDGNNQPIFQPGSTYNLCGNQTHCSYLTNGSSFTAWIDYTPQQTLEVRLLQTRSYGEKPLVPLLVFPNYKFAPELGEYISLHFIGSSAANGIVAHELSIWNFNSNSVPSMIVALSPKRWIALSLGAGGIVLAILVLFMFYRLWFARNWNSKAINCPLGTRVFLYKELRKATKNFSEKEKIGSGAFGTVYRGSFGDKLVAVKCINYESKYGETTFYAEISSLSLIQHQNVVQLQGWCHEKNRNFLLVYDYMSNGNLNEWLHGCGDNHEHNSLLSWKLRKRILEEVAVALEYLHSDCVQCVVHRDIKSSNVMLDAEFKAHVGDFGLARLVNHKKHDRTTMAAGTFGYMAPELPHTGKATKNSDVYSFGILILEVVCGRHPLDLKAQIPENTILLNCVWRAQELGMLLSMADPKLCHASPPYQVEVCHNNESIGIVPSDYNMPFHAIKGDVKVERMIKNLLHLGLICCLPNPKARPTMEQVTEILQQINDIDNIDDVIAPLPPLPKTKPLGLYSSIEFSQIVELSHDLTKSTVT